MESMRSLILGLLVLGMGYFSIWLGLHFERGTKYGRSHGVIGGEVATLGGLNLGASLPFGIVFTIAGLIIIFYELDSLLELNLISSTNSLARVCLIPIVFFAVIGFIRGLLFPVKWFGPKWLREEIQKGKIRDVWP